MVFQVSAMVRTLSKGEESTQALDDGVGPLPRDAVRRSLDDLDSRIRRARARQLRLSDVLRVARAGDPERRQRELMQAREGRGNGLAQLARAKASSRRGATWPPKSGWAFQSRRSVSQSSCSKRRAHASRDSVAGLTRVEIRTAAWYFAPFSSASSATRPPRE